MKVRILCAGRFSDFDVPGRPNKVGAKRLAVGDVVDYPNRYAESIIASGLAMELPSLAFEGAISVTPAANKLAAQEGIDLRVVMGTGQGGRITVGDVRKAAG